MCAISARETDRDAQLFRNVTLRLAEEEAKGVVASYDARVIMIHGEMIEAIGHLAFVGSTNTPPLDRHDRGQEKQPGFGEINGRLINECASRTDISQIKERHRRRQ